MTEDRKPLSYWGAYSLMRRAKKRTGIGRVHAHLSRHGIAHRAADQGAQLGLTYAAYLRSAHHNFAERDRSSGRPRFNH